MRTFSIYTLGCKVNQYESAQIAQLLEELGLSAGRVGRETRFSRDKYLLRNRHRFSQEQTIYSKSVKGESRRRKGRLRVSSGDEQPGKSPLRRR